MNKKNAKIRKDIEKYRKKQRETEAHLQVLNTMRIEAENEELSFTPSFTTKST